MIAKLKFCKKENGQAAVLLALVFIVLLGFVALTMDIGRATVEKSDLQNAADASALAGAQSLPDSSAAISAATSYAQKNGVAASQVTVTTPYEGDANEIGIVCRRTVSYSFARILGYTETTVSVSAVARKSGQWAGEALPFINLDDDYTVNPEIVAWEKTTPGDFESIDNYEIMNQNDPDKCYFKVDYLNGVELKKGTVADKKQEVGYVYEQHQPDKLVYVLSLSSDVIKSGSVKLKDGTIRSLDKLKNNDVIDVSQLVLLACIFHDYDYKGKTLYLTTQKVYDIAHNQFPSDYVNPDGSSARLVK